jgi:hypothetical protein
MLQLDASTIDSSFDEQRSNGIKDSPQFVPRELDGLDQEDDANDDPLSLSPSLSSTSNIQSGSGSAVSLDNDNKSSRDLLTAAGPIASSAAAANAASEDGGGSSSSGKNSDMARDMAAAAGGGSGMSSIWVSCGSGGEREM